ncbi:glycoside hydrolase family 43 protein [Paraglaciecola hydrolytica]|uniref:Alpha-N-arabinofuranosidase n=1 Tax=Paraglaciecola hydrolytica TaxID=1799789 RepID=A0A136A2B5_9ALTE|nr:glycoside hydrolase family 43 protein [Paraglaciecola hydrolytica]KXI29389.1 alpha-N-arabinofuranosidase [Paraglaciecola hydrolytica]
MSEELLPPEQIQAIRAKAISQPLVENIYTADPSAHVFDGKIYIYPSHDIEAGIPFNDNGDHFGMEDYHVISMDSPDSPAVDNGVALHVKDVPWAARQMWAPDAAKKGDLYYFYFPAKKADDIFQIGVAVGDSPIGPFVAQPEPIKGSYTIDPAVFEDEDGEYYMYFGGIWGGQLQHYRKNQYDATLSEPADHEPQLGPIVAKMSDDMLEFAETPKEILILDENGQPLLAGDHDRRFFEASWMHKYDGKYYFSYSTGNTHFLCYAMGDSPYGPFTYGGRILEPVLGWTTHHSIAEFEGKWYLFYHDSSLSSGITHLRSVKMAEITYDKDGKINTLKPYRD